MGKASFRAALAGAVVALALAGPRTTAGEKDSETRSELQALTDLHARQRVISSAPCGDCGSLVARLGRCSSG